MVNVVILAELEVAYPTHPILIFEQVHHVDAIEVSLDTFPTQMAFAVISRMQTEPRAQSRIDFAPITLTGLPVYFFDYLGISSTVFAHVRIPILGIPTIVLVLANLFTMFGVVLAAIFIECRPIRITFFLNVNAILLAPMFDTLCCAAHSSLVSATFRLPVLTA